MVKQRVGQISLASYFQFQFHLTRGLQTRVYYSRTKKRNLLKASKRRARENTTYIPLVLIVDWYPTPTCFCAVNVPSIQKCI